ncbi:MAG TPA: MarR family transcriptional regulator [Micromonosporaceae bacterium]|nr:MarR family transcriptional regulator [Micromonosporaceae bacterium]
MPNEDPIARAELTFLLGMGFQLLIREFVTRLDEAGYADLRPVHGLVFQILRGPGATVTELAEQIGVTKQAAGQMIDDLERRGYVRRQAHPDGGRRRLVVLTDQAYAHLAVAGRVLHGLERELAERLGDDEVAHLRAVLARLVRHLAGETLPPLRPVW